MNFVDLLRYGDPGASPPTQTILLSLVLAFLVGQVIGWVYMLTHTTASYSSSFVASLVILPVIVSLMMILLTGSLVIAFGLLAVFAVVRFRNVLKDTRDTTYIMWSIVEGMAMGIFHYSTAIVGGCCVMLVLLYLWLTEFGVRHRFDAALSVSVPTDAGATREKIEQILLRFSDRILLTSERLSFDARQVLSYRLLLRDPTRRTELRDDLATVSDVQELSFYLQEDESEL
jgi:uncharacterized membrane protein YhiD involved in acid resistance